MRLIDAKELEKRFYDNVEEGITDPFDAFDFAVDECPTIEAARWIPVTERLPHKEWEEAVANGMDLYSCLAVEKYDGFKPVAVKTWFDGEGFIDIVGIDISIRITHWMPLPTPPKDGDSK